MEPLIIITEIAASAFCGWLIGYSIASIYDMIKTTRIRIEKMEQNVTITLSESELRLILANLEDINEHIYRLENKYAIIAPQLLSHLAAIAIENNIHPLKD